MKNWASDADNLKYVTWDPHPNPQVTRASIERWLLHYQEENTYKWAICKKDDPAQVIGDISVVSQDSQKNCVKIGYYSREELLGSRSDDRSPPGCFTLLLVEVGFKEVQAKYVSFEPCFGTG